MTEVSTEDALLAALKLDDEKIHPDALKWVRNLIDHNECGVAYDALVFEIGNGAYLPSEKALSLIKHAASQMGIEFPNLSC